MAGSHLRRHGEFLDPLLVRGAQVVLADLDRLSGALRFDDRVADPALLRHAIVGDVRLEERAGGLVGQQTRDFGLQPGRAHHEEVELHSLVGTLIGLFDLPIGDADAVADQLDELLREDLFRDLALELLERVVVGSQHLLVAVRSDEDTVLLERRELHDAFLHLAIADGEPLVPGRRQDQTLLDELLEHDLFELNLLQKIVRKLTAADLLVVRGLLLQRLLVLADADGFSIDAGNHVGRPADQGGDVEGNERDDDEPQHPGEVADVAAHCVEHF